MYGRPEDKQPSPYPDAPKPLDGMALTQAVQALRYLVHFHTVDVIRNPRVNFAHRDAIESPDFRERVEGWMRREALFLGLRGPLPGHPTRGARWAWQVPEVDLADGHGQPFGPSAGGQGVELDPPDRKPG